MKKAIIRIILKDINLDKEKIIDFICDSVEKYGQLDKLDDSFRHVICSLKTKDNETVDNPVCILGMVDLNRSNYDGFLVERLKKGLPDALEIAVESMFDGVCYSLLEARQHSFRSGWDKFRGVIIAKIELDKLYNQSIINLTTPRPKTYRVTLREEVTYVAEVEAETEEEAMEKAMEQGIDSSFNAVGWNQIDIEAEEVQQ